MSNARPPGQSPIDEHPEIPFTKEWGGVVRRARMALGMSQAELGAKVGVDQPMISYIERGEVLSSKAVTNLVHILKIPPPDQLFEDELDQQWVEVGRLLRRNNENALRGLLAAAEHMIKKTEPEEH